MLAFPVIFVYLLFFLFSKAVMIIKYNNLLNGLFFFLWHVIFSFSVVLIAGSVAK